MKSLFVSLFFLCSLVATPSWSQEDSSPVFGTILFGGADARENNRYGFAGAIHAMNGNLAYDGVLVRAFGLLGAYDYDSTAVVGGNVDGDVRAFDVMLGYQKYYDPFFARIYAGVEYEDHYLSPNNPFDSNRGGDFGFKVQGEIETNYFSPVYGNLIASYGTAKSSYWARGRVGHVHAEKLVFGAEAILAGNQEYDETRFGGFVTIREFGSEASQLVISGGVSNTESNRGGQSGYIAFEISTAF